ncbi:MAG: serine/threonine protein kinase [Planctomycetaceae bacterium]
MEHDHFGPYKVTRLLGRGGMGAVYEAVEPSSGRRVAVKTIPVHLANDEGVRRRFQSEISTLMKLRHPGIARMEGWGMQNGLPFFAMELVPGTSLEAILRSGQRFSWQDTVTRASEIVRALKYAHDQGVVHRDLKPANLMLPPSAGGGYQVKLTDFGIAKLFGETGLTSSGQVIGTPEFMAPEHAANGLVDHRADLYCLGLVMFTMVVGRPPFQGALADVLAMQRSRKPPRVRTLVPDVPQSLDELIWRLLDKTPGRRPANAAIVAKLLADIAATSPVSAAPPPRELAPSAGSSPGQATTVVTDTSGQSGGAPGTPGGQIPARSHGDATTFTTVEEAARQHRARRAREKQMETWLGILKALAIILPVVFIGSCLLRPALFPTVDERFRKIKAIREQDVGDEGSLEDVCGHYAAFLTRFPDDVRAQDVRKWAREKGLDNLRKRLEKTALVLKKEPQPGEAAGLDFERVYLQALWAARNEKLDASLEKLRAIVNDKRAKDDTPDDVVPATPCSIADHPDPAAWKELADRKIRELEKIRDERTADDLKDAGTKLRNIRIRLQQATQSVEPKVRQENVAATILSLKGFIEAFESKPHLAPLVTEAQRLLEAAEGAAGGASPATPR